MEASTTPYSDSFDILIALVTHLASTHRQSRTVPGLARDLGFNADQVRSTLDGFPGLFRKSRRTNREGEPYYTVHLRYARRPLPEDQESEETENKPLSSQELTSLFDLITQMVARESETSKLLIEQENQMRRLSAELGQRNRTLLWTSIITLIAAAIAASAAIYAASIKPPAKTVVAESSACSLVSWLGYDARAPRVNHIHC